LFTSLNLDFKYLLPNQIKPNKVRLPLMDKKALFALIACFFVFSFGKVNPTEKEKINWMSLEEANVKMMSESRPVLMDLYTNWCYWCKVMDKKTYNNARVISYINDHFYAVRVNAEAKDTVVWDNKKYTFNSNDKINNFAIYVTQGQLAFPNTIIFPEMDQQPASIPGYMEPKEIEVTLKYFGEGNYKTENFSQFSKDFKATW
jgi:thioredoxin-related protein